jgi:hypothetical protein
MACPHAQRLCHHRRNLGAGSRLLHPRRRRSVTLRESAQQRLGTRGAQSAPCPSPGEDLDESDPPMLGALYPTCSCAECKTGMRFRAVRRAGNKIRQQRQKLQSCTQKLQSRSRPEETWCRWGLGTRGGGPLPRACRYHGTTSRPELLALRALRGTHNGGRLQEWPVCCAPIERS